MKETLRPTIRPSRARLVTLALVPLVTWSISLLFSYLIQDFACAAAQSAGQPVPATGLRVLLIVMNAVLLAVTIGSGALAGSSLRRPARPELNTVDRFLAVSAVAFAALVCFSIVMIGVNPLVLEVCT